MVTVKYIFALIGSLLFKSAISASINYEPIKITVNENFNGQPGQVSTELQALDPGVLHQGANFYFKPQLNLPQSFIPSHIEALMSLVQQHNHSCAKDASKVVVEKDKLIEILQPFMHPLSKIPKETLLENVLEKENNLEIVKPPEIIEKIETETLPVIINEEPKPVTPDLLVIPEAPVLPPFSFNDVPAFIKKEVKKEESVILEEPTSEFSTIPEIVRRPTMKPLINYVEPKLMTSKLVNIPEAPELPPLSTNDTKLIEDGVKFNKPTVVDVESNPTVQEYLVIPEAPVLPRLTIHDIHSIVKEEVKKDESIIFEEVTGKIPSIPEIDVRPITEPIINYVEPKFIASELVNIPEAPVLPSLSYKGIPSNIEEEINKEETVIAEGQRGAFPTIPEIAVIPIQEAIINYVEPKPINTELKVIPEAPVLPPLSANDIKMIEDGVKINEPIVVNVESKPAIQEYVIIPEAPVLPPLAIHDIPSFVEEEVKKEEPIIFKEPTEVFSTIPEIAVRPIEEPINNYVEPEPTISDFLVIPEAPVLPPLSANDIKMIEDGVKINETIVVNVESKPAIQEYVIIPEAPVLPPLAIHDIPSFVEEEVKKEEPIIFKEPTEVFSTISEIAVRPIEEPIINYVEPEPTTSDFLVIPEAPVLPPLSANDIRLIEDGVKIEESVIVNVESKPAIQELAVIPEAPVLPPLSRHDVLSIEEEEVKKGESVISEKSTDWSSTISKVSVAPIPEPIINYDEPKSAASKLGFIPEATVLPPLLAKDIHVIEEEVKIEEPVIVDEPRPFISNHIVIPEAPVIPDLSNNRIPPIGQERTLEASKKVEESTDVIPSNPQISSIPIPEPIVVSEMAESISLKNNNFPAGKEEVKIEIPILLEETIELLPPIAEISSGATLETIQEPEMTNSFVLEEVSQLNPERVVTVKETLPPTIIPKPSNNLGIFSYAPFVSHLSNRAPKTNKLTIAKPASLERFLLKKHPFRLPVTPYPKLSLNDMKAPIWENKKQFLYPTSYAHDVVEKRIAPNMAFKKLLLPNV